MLRVSYVKQRAIWPRWLTVANRSGEKGARFEREVAAFVDGIRVRGSGADRSGLLNECDIEPRAGSPFEGTHIEAKVRANLAVDTWFAQAVRGAVKSRRTPVLFIKRDRGPMLCVLDAVDLKLLLEGHRLGLREAG